MGQRRAALGRVTRGVGPSLVVLAAGMARRYGGCKPLAPIGPNGEAVIDLLVSDAVASGFGQVVLVLHPETGPAIRYHVEQCWPVRRRGGLRRTAAPPRNGPRRAGGQGCPRCRPELRRGQRRRRLRRGGHGPAGPASARSGTAEHALVGYQLRATVATDDPVTRGICMVDDDGHLVGLTERRQVSRHGPDEDLTSADGLEPIRARRLPSRVGQPVGLPARHLGRVRSGHGCLRARRGGAAGLRGCRRGGARRPRCCCPRWWPPWWPPAADYRCGSSPPTPS